MISGHWFTVSMYSALQWCHIRCIYRLKCTGVFDSMYGDLDQESTSQILSILKHEGKFVKFHMITVQRQVGGTECGVFAIAFAVALSFGLNPTKLIFDQSKMRTHLITCLSKKFQTFHLVLIQIGKKENK